MRNSSDLIGRAREFIDRREAPVVLELDLTQRVITTQPHDLVSAALARRRASLRSITEALRRAATDPGVVGLVGRIDRAGLGLGAVQEVRDAVLAFRKSGKPAIAWAESFGEGDPGTIQYYLATAFDTIWLTPLGQLCFTGAASRSYFLRDALDKAGIRSQVGQRYEYKSAGDLVTQRDFTPAHREASQRVLTSFMDQIVEGVAAARELTAETVWDTVNGGPLGAGEATERGFVDAVGYRDEVLDAIRERTSPDAEPRYVSRYRKNPGISARLRGPQPVIGLVFATGAIKRGRSGPSPFGSAMGSDTVCAALRAAIADDKVRAIVLRVDSPGGGVVASDLIWRETVLAKRAGKPLVVSMGDVAASGGYYISAAADTIVADPGTVTGSIGVVTQKFVTTGLTERLGVNRGVLTAGAHADMFGSTRPYDDTELAVINTWLDDVYEGFVRRVADGRDMSRDQVHDIARGRVWTGADAAERGLVDELGGLTRAIEVATAKAALPPGVEPAVRVVPRTTPMDMLRAPQSSEDVPGASLFGGWGRYAGLAARLGLPAAGPLSLPDGLVPVW